MRAGLQALWYRPRPPPLWLRPLSAAFGAIIALRRAAYAHGWLKAQRIGLPVIIVGNLTVGGSGKTPLTAWIAGQLRAAGFAPGIVLRGYGGSLSARGETALVETDSDPAEVGDEALLLRRRTGVPVAVGADRVRAARLLLARRVDVVVADDGLQHLALARDVELVVLDGERGTGNGWLLPAGPLREPAARLALADAVIVNGPGRVWQSVATGPVSIPLRRPPVLMRLRGEHLLAADGTDRALSLSRLAGCRVHAIAGIGHPQRFFSQLRAAGLDPVEHAFPDHHDFVVADLRFDEDLPVLMTEKDAVKCASLAGENCWFLPVEAEFEASGAAALLDCVLGAIRARARSSSGE